MNFPEVRAMGGVGLGGAGLPPTHTPTTPTPTQTDSSLPPVPPPVPSPPEATPYLSFQSTPGLSSPPAVSHPSIATMWGIGGFTTPPMPTPPPVVCPNTIASTLGIPQMPNVTYFNSRAPMGFNFRMAGSLNGVPYVFKRKPEEEPEEIKQVAKQHISEERMMAHLNSLHLSDRYCNHRLGKGKLRRKGGVTVAGVTGGAGGGAGDIDEDEGLGGEGAMSLDGSPIIASASDLQGAPRLVIADEVKRIVPGESKLPESILKKLTQPSMEVVLWQPPTNILRTVIPPSIDNQIKASQSTTTTATTSTSSATTSTVSSNVVSSTTSSSSSSPDSGISITSPPPASDSFIGRNSSIVSPSISTALNEAVAAAAARAGGGGGGSCVTSPQGFPSPSNDPNLSLGAVGSGGSGGVSGNFAAPSAELGLDLLSLPSTSSGSRGSGFLPLPLRRPASPLPDPMADDDFSERMEFNNNNGNAPNFMWLEENNNTALMDLNAVEPQRAAAAAPAAAPAQLPPQPPLPEDLPDFPDSDDMDL
ncbi:NHS-like protein 1 isoform X2 [Eriocheir sinensis]|uniref:NHS-like protein 1 isoform X2 n=1 Tax=Eriocheir sinensis TaxID=95602 RepID=UPI0021C5E519|nr:NHS-like protein 1 isoform X2 [Eriocheir sinensis]